MGEENIELEEPEVIEEAPSDPPEDPPKDPEEGKVEFSPEQQAIFNEEIGKKVGKQREAERKYEEAERRAKELEAKLAERESTEKPIIPTPPDPYDDDYDAKMQARDEAIAKAAAWEREEAAKDERERLQQEQAQREQQENLYKTVREYSDRAKLLGVGENELQQAGTVINSRGMDDAVTQHILEDERGPEITLYLAANPVEQEKLREMGPLRAAAYIEGTIKPAARRQPPEPPPDPVETELGGGFKEEYGLDGATYE